MSPSSRDPAPDTSPDLGDDTVGTADRAAPEPATTPPAGTCGRQERLETSRAGRLVISTFAAITLAALLVVNMPASETKKAVAGTAQIYINALGIDQAWNVFAPDPRRTSSFAEARLQQADGSVHVEQVPIQHGLAAYWDYRWRRWGNAISFEPGQPGRWAPYCRWLVERDRDAGGHPVQISLMAYSSETLPPGPGPDRTPWTLREVYAVGVGS